jgi:hypothetical protein
MCENLAHRGKSATIQPAVLEEYAHHNALFWLGKTPVFPGVSNTLVKKGKEQIKSSSPMPM